MIKSFVSLFILMIFYLQLHAQNVGIGTTNPENKLQVQGSLVVTTPVMSTTTEPTPAQTKTLLNGSHISVGSEDSTWRIYDPGGPNGNYLPNLTAIFSTSTSYITVIGYELTIENIDLSSGDSLIFYAGTGGRRLLALGNYYSTAGKWVFNGSFLRIEFKSNADANVASGFSLLVCRLFSNASSLPDVSGFTHNTFLFDVKKGSVSAGNISAVSPGTHSVAMGNGSAASGPYSVALGGFNRATANGSTALGYLTIADGVASLAAGYNTLASGGASTALGKDTKALGSSSTAMGDNTIASGDYSTAIGSNVSTNNHNGSLIIGDRSTTTILTIATPNSFRARFDGGYRFFTSAAAINAESCQLPAGGNAWLTSSDYRLKEKFALVNGESFLKKIAAMPLGSWNYITQNPHRQRHYGPMAQDFYAAFGKDEYGTIGNDTTINTADFDGVNLIAIQALEKRTSTMQKQAAEENRKLKEELAGTRELLLLLQKEMDKLKAENRK